MPAQSPVLDAVGAGERAQREERDRQEQEFRRAREAQQELTSIAIPAPERVVPVADEVKREINELVIEGADNMRPGFRKGLQSRFTGLLGISDVRALLSDITRHYILRGYATTRAYLPEQDLSTGTLRVLVVEGRIESYAGDLPPNVFPGEPGDLLNLRSVEQGIENLNRLASNDAELELVPGSTPGDTVVAIQNNPGRRWHLSGSLDNSGSEDTGRNQASLTLAYDNLVGLADYLSVTHRRAVPYHSGREASEATTVSYTVPWDWTALTVGGSASSYALTFFAPSGTPLPFNGDSRFAFLSVDHLLFRDQNSRLKLDATLNWRSSKNYILGNLIDVSSRDTTNLEVGADFSTVVANGTLMTRAGLVFGLPWFGSLEDPSGLPGYAPKAEFTKVMFDVRYSRPFTVAKQRLLFSSSVNAQFGSDVLYGTDQLTGGGQYAVRGFDESNPAGDWGFVWRNDVSVPFEVNLPAGPSLGLRPYLGLDVGRLWSNVDGLPDSFVPPEGGLAGGAVGVSFSYRQANFDISYHHNFDRPVGVPDEDGRFYARASFSY